MRPSPEKKTHGFSLPSDSMESLIAANPTLATEQFCNNLKFSESQLELAAEMADIGLWSLDLEKNIFWLNNKTREMFQFPRLTEITFEHFLDKVYLDDRQSIHQAINRAMQGERLVNVKYRIVLPDGSMRWVLTRGAQHNCAGKDSTCLMGASADITDRIESEVLIRRHLEFESILSETSAAFLSFKMMGNVDEQIESTLARLLNYFGGDRCGLIKLDLIKKKSRITHAFYREGFEQVAPDTDLVALFPWTFNRSGEGLCVHFSDVSELPTEANVDRQSWESMGVKSALQIPLPVLDDTCFLILIQSLTSIISWPLETFPRLKLLGEVLTNAIYKKMADETIKNSLQEIKKLNTKLEHEAEYLRREVHAANIHKEIVGQGESIKKVLYMVAQVASTSSTVLVCGETGTGKELIAQAIHEDSPRRGKLMVKVNCASLPSALIESELFGREKGAYTGALTRQMGRFELADGSTLFLDEISELPMELQAKLLRVLQEGEFERLGSPKTIKVDVRVIAATNRDLFKEVKKGRFREDLYYRLNVFPLVVPPLRERQEDIPVLVWEFVRVFNEKMGKRIQRIPKGKMAMLQAHSWPGNIRELRNVIEYAAIVSSGDELNIKLPNHSHNDSNHSVTLEEMESSHILSILRKTGWRIKGEDGAAQILGINPATLYSRMKKLGISLDEKKTAYNP